MNSQGKQTWTSNVDGTKHIYKSVQSDEVQFCPSYGEEQQDQLTLAGVLQKKEVASMQRSGGGDESKEQEQEEETSYRGHKEGRKCLIGRTVKLYFPLHTYYEIFYLENFP